MMMATRFFLLDDMWWRDWNWTCTATIDMMMTTVTRGKFILEAHSYLVLATSSSGWLVWHYLL